MSSVLMRIHSKTRSGFNTRVIRETGTEEPDHLKVLNITYRVERQSGQRVEGGEEVWLV